MNILSFKEKMVTEPQYLNFPKQATLISNFVAVPFCVSALGVYLYNAIFNGFRSYKFGLVLLIMSYDSLLQVLLNRMNPYDTSYWS